MCLESQISDQMTPKGDGLWEYLAFIHLRKRATCNQKLNGASEQHQLLVKGDLCLGEVGQVRHHEEVL